MPGRALHSSSDKASSAALHPSRHEQGTLPSSWRTTSIHTVWGDRRCHLHRQFFGTAFLFSMHSRRAKPHKQTEKRRGSNMRIQRGRALHSGSDKAPSAALHQSGQQALCMEEQRALKGFACTACGWAPRLSFLLNGPHGHRWSPELAEEPASMRCEPSSRNTFYRITLIPVRRRFVCLLQGSTKSWSLLKAIHGPLHNFRARAGQGGWRDCTNVMLTQKCSLRIYPSTRTTCAQVSHLHETRANTARKAVRELGRAGPMLFGRL